MFVYGWNIPVAAPEINSSCNGCDLYHDESKFSGWKCVCECHAQKITEVSSKDVSCELDWDRNEESTTPYGT
jgi:hypothetical protein